MLLRPFPDSRDLLESLLQYSRCLRMSLKERQSLSSCSVEVLVPRDAFCPRKSKSTPRLRSTTPMQFRTCANANRDMRQSRGKMFDRLHRRVLTPDRKLRTNKISTTNPSSLSSELSKVPHAYAGNAAELGNLPVIARALIGGNETPLGCLAVISSGRGRLHFQSPRIPRGPSRDDTIAPFNCCLGTRN